MYFSRATPTRPVDAKTVDADVLCGEIVGMPLASLQSVVGSVYRPMLGAQELWGKASDDQVAHGDSRGVDVRRSCERSFVLRG